MERLTDGRTDLRVQLVSKPGTTKTGIGRYAFELERGLRAAGVDVRSASLTQPLPEPVARLGRRAGYDVEAFFRSYPLRADVRPGYITHLTSQTLATLLLTQRLPRPVVVTVHDILPYLLRDDPALSVYRNQAQRLFDALAMRGLRRADRLIADSHYTKRTVVDALGIPAGRIDVVHLGVDTERFRPLPVPNAFRMRYGLPADRRYVLYVGSEDPRKNVPLLLRAFAMVRRELPDLILLKVGAAAFPEQRVRHRELAASLGIADAVRWIDDVPEEDLPLCYNVADVLAFPSRYEGFGFPVLEALACGTPVVALRASSVPELVGDAAVLIDDPAPNVLAAALADVLARPRPEAEPLVSRTRPFSWWRTLAATHETYGAYRTREKGVAWTFAS